MKKVLLILLVALCSLSIHSQYKRNSFELSGGVNKHISPLNDPNTGLHLNGLYRYNINPKFGMGFLVSYDQLSNNHPTCNYDTSAINISPSIFYRFLRKKNWAVVGSVGVGGSQLGEETLLNFVVGGTLYRKITERLSAKIGYMATSYLYQENALDNSTPITSNGVNSYTNQLFAGLSLRLGKGDTHADFYKAVVEKEVIRELEIRTEKETIIREIVESRVEKVAVPNEYLFFLEGKTDIQKEGYASIARARQFMLLNPEYLMAIVGYSCGGHGSFDRNMQLSIERSKEVYDQFISTGISKSRVTYRGLGVDKVFKHENQHLQKRVELIFYKVGE